MLRVTLVFRDGSTDTFDVEAFNAHEALDSNPDIREVIVSEIQGE